MSPSASLTTSALSSALAFALAATLISSRAVADDKVACVKASDEAQQLRDEGKLTKARDRMLFCASSKCPGLVRTDCSEMLTKLEASLPSVVIGADDGSGHDLTEAHVTLDGAPFLDSLDGKAVRMDPGPHTLRFEVAGREPVELSVVVREGERNRVILAHLPAPKETAIQPPQPVAEAPPPAPASRPIPTAAFILGGVALAAAGSFAVFGVIGKNDLSGLHDTCGLTRSCAQSDVDAARTKLIVADVSLGVSVSAAVVATILVLTRGPGAPPKSAGLLFNMSASPRSATTLTWSF